MTWKEVLKEAFPYSIVGALIPIAALGSFFGVLFLLK